MGFFTTKFSRRNKLVYKVMPPGLIFAPFVQKFSDMKTCLYIFSLVLLAAEGAQAQKNLLTTGLGYVIFNDGYSIEDNFDGVALQLNYERAAGRHLSWGAAINWQLLESRDYISISYPYNFGIYTVRRQAISIGPTLRYYFGKHKLRGLYLGVFGGYNQLHFTTDNLPEGHFLADSPDESSGSLGLLYGFRFKLSTRWGLFAEGRHEKIWFGKEVQGFSHQIGGGFSFAF